MSDAVFMEFDDPAGGRHPWDSAPRGQKKKTKGRKKDDEPKKAVIPKLPEPEPLLTGDEVRRGVSDRNRAAAKLWALGDDFLTIADKLEFEDAKAARRAVESVVAATASDQEIEMVRHRAVTRAEMLFKQSLAMGTADYFVDDEGNKIPNTERLRWHQQASTDLMNIATLTGAKAPTRVEITPGEAELQRIVDTIVLRSGHQDIVDAEVIDLDQIPAIEAAETDDEDGDDEWDDVRG